MSLARQIVRLILQKEYRCVFFSLICDTVILCYLMQYMAITPMITGAVLDIFLLAMTVAAINFESAPLFMPNIVIKSLLDIFLILLGCSTIDTLNAELVQLEVETSTLQTSPYTKWQHLLLTYPTLPLWLLLFVLLLTAQIRLLLGQWYRIVFSSTSGSSDEAPQEKNPPPYDKCMKTGIPSISSLPTYEEAIQKRKNTSLLNSPSSTSSTSVNIVCINECDRESPTSPPNLTYFLKSKPNPIVYPSASAESS